MKIPHSSLAARGSPAHLVKQVEKFAGTKDAIG
jgi:hypothetical protein